MNNASATLTMLWADLADNKLVIFSYLSQKIAFDTSCKLSPMETICMKYQSLFSGKNKNISKCRLLKIISSMLSDKQCLLDTLCTVMTS